MQAALLPDRGVVKVAGDDARQFLNGLVTADMAKVTPEQARFAALLTPQGKIIADFIIAEATAEDGGGFFLDCPKMLVPNLVTRLTMYKLRAKVSVEDFSDTVGVMAAWGGEATTDHGLVYRDPRVSELGLRVIVPFDAAAEAAADLGAALVDAAEYEAHRIGLAVPRGGFDFMYNDAFPHETGMDHLGGIDFDKGCYVGQEVVSRMEHRGTARTRTVAVTFEDFAPECGLPVLAGEKPAGMMGSSVRGRGIALLRLDRAADALAAGVPLTSGGFTLEAVRPPWARFEVPTGKAAE
jgi:folate-binding protein YgfZ